MPLFAKIDLRGPQCTVCVYLNLKFASRETSTSRKKTLKPSLALYGSDWLKKKKSNNETLDGGWGCLTVVALISFALFCHIH